MSDILTRLRLFRSRQGRFATIDEAKAAPPPSPLAPIDLTDPAQVTGVMDLAARIGGYLLYSGTGNHDTRAHVHTVCSAYGLHYVHVDITFNTIQLFTQIDTGQKIPITVFRVVPKLDLDFSKLAEIDRLIRSIQAGATPPNVAEQIMNDLTSMPPPYGIRTALVGWAALAAAVAVLLGGGWLVSVISFLTALVIMAGHIWLEKKGLPEFYRNMYGGFVATLPAAMTYNWALENGINLAPGQIIASGIIVLLAGLTLVQAIQDGITGAPVTASARFFQTIMLTGGIIAGVAIGIQASTALGVTLPPLEATTPANFASSSAKVLAGAAASAAFAVAAFAEWPSVWISGITSFAGSACYYFVLLPLGMSPVVGLGITATIIGLAGGLLARRFLIPPLITAVAGITPLLPGLTIYRGMYTLLNEQLVQGFGNMALALAIGSSLAAGVVLGEWVARKLRRPPPLNRYTSFARRSASSFRHSKPVEKTARVVRRTGSVVNRRQYRARKAVRSAKTRHPGMPGGATGAPDSPNHPDHQN
ncbi:threonine/serine exporter family protein [Corynebacterium sp. CCM 9185]|uniref:threonine/serine exporter ThrE n=1 Tax=Corynebacterium marambiense TaxID=2765364 RepID=UPI002006C19F|nr:threonine/serine exporter family protein [Corynebacterium marambiense]MCK7664322.1 threonine/serine exporter family protein [Corynebacterium marambiense]MCX7543135.1 threonine/serine exporter family protein [Corynebacterium marambiense]